MYEYAFSSPQKWDDVETLVGNYASNGWKLHTMHEDTQRGRYRLIFERTKQKTVGNRAFERKL